MTGSTGERLKGFFSVFRFSRRAVALVWQTNRRLTLILAVLTLVAGVLPAAAAWVGKLIVDGVVAAIASPDPSASGLLWLVALEGLIIGAIAGAQTGISVCQELLRAQLGHRVNVMILEKALTLDLAQFEDSEFYDKLTRARREASSRPLSLVIRTFGLIQNMIAIVSFGALLWQFSPLAVLILAFGGIPAFIAEVKYSGAAFRLFYWRSPETRKQMYLETVLAREDYAKEVKLFQLGPLLLGRYRQIFRDLYLEDRQLTLRRGFWGFVLGLIGTAALYGSYVWVVLSAVAQRITLGQMTMYMMVFKQGQSAVSASLNAINGMYDDNLYLSNLYEFLEQPGRDWPGKETVGLDADAGLVFRGVTFRYPGAETAALDGVDLEVRPGESLAIVGSNGSGKTTLVKLLTGLYEPQDGQILYQGRPLATWDRATLQQRFAVIFQDFARYQLLLGENIGAGDVAAFGDPDRWARAGSQGMVDDFIEELPAGFQTQLGKWFQDGRELSGGQWQKVALARAFMRESAEVLVLDEPTAAMDAEAEARIFEHFRSLARDKITLLISHRFSTVRMADRIVVIERGRIVERGSHGELMDLDGRYARLFRLQARGYREE
ncbi:MAG: ABC transporter ATP-binding protein, partial [Xanthomonadales bacterium]|nr:ABC transporter ATP-binding protein [Xanthomonadales bacterium]